MNITCTANINAVDTPIDSHIQWFHDSIMISNTPRTVVYELAGDGTNSTFESVLEFNPIDNGDNSIYNDSGNYTCEVILRSDNILILEANQTENIELTVTGIVTVIMCSVFDFFWNCISDIPNMEVFVQYTGSTVVGVNSSLYCNAMPIMGLLGDISLTWEKTKGPDIVTLSQTGNNMTDATVTFMPLLFNDRGVYRCTFSFGSSLTNDNISINEIYTLNVSCKAYFDSIVCVEIE